MSDTHANWGIPESWDEDWYTGLTGRAGNDSNTVKGWDNSGCVNSTDGGNGLTSIVICDRPCSDKDKKRCSEKELSDREHNFTLRKTRSTLWMSGTVGYSLSLGSRRYFIYIYVFLAFSNLFLISTKFSSKATLGTSR